MHKQPHLDRIVLCTMKKPLKSREIRVFYGNDCVNHCIKRKKVQKLTIYNFKKANWYDSSIESRQRLKADSHNLGFKFLSPSTSNQGKRMDHE